MTYAVIVPLKRTSRGKSRLQLPDDQRAALATAMVRDTLAAVTAVPAVRSVLVVAEDAADAAVLTSDRVDVLITEARGLNAAISEGVREFDRRGWSGPVAVLPGDLPFLTADDLAGALQQAAGRTAVVADADGTGTTLLVAANASGLTPRFGVDSFRRHQDAGATPIRVAAGSTLHMDVDTVADLHLPDDGDRLGSYTRAALTVLAGPSAAESVQVTVLP